MKYPTKFNKIGDKINYVYFYFFDKVLWEIAIKM
jgi:hypothetical protein